MTVRNNSLAFAAVVLAVCRGAVGGMVEPLDDRYGLHGMAEGALPYLPSTAVIKSSVGDENAAIDGDTVALSTTRKWFWEELSQGSSTFRMDRVTRTRAFDHINVSELRSLGEADRLATGDNALSASHPPALTGC